MMADMGVNMFADIVANKKFLRPNFKPKVIRLCKFIFLQKIIIGFYTILPVVFSVLIAQILTKELLFVTLKWAKYQFLLLKSFLVFLGMTLWLRIGNDRAGHITLLRRRRRILYQLLIIHILCSTVIKYSAIQILISFSITHCSLASEINVLNANCLEI